MEFAYERLDIHVLVVYAYVGIVSESYFCIIVRIDAFVVHNLRVGDEYYLVVLA